MVRGSRKGQGKWNIILETGLKRESVGISSNSRMRDREACRCLYPAGIPACAWYRMTLWIILDTEPPIMSSILDLEQAREGCRCCIRLSTPIYEKILIIRNMI